MSIYLHEHQDFISLINILAEEKGIEAGLIEKDYWMMHVLHGLKIQGFEFELKGGTSLSKGYNLIHRFSEDIDIHIKPPAEFRINENPKNCKETIARNRRVFYEWLAKEIKIPGIVSVERDVAFDDLECYRSGGIRLHYKNVTNKVQGVKDGILLEAGFDDVTPNLPLSISSWAFNKAFEVGVDILDNRAIEVACYHPGYTFVEKLQTIATKFRNEQLNGKKGPNFMRQYYDIYCLLYSAEVLDFIGTDSYYTHKKRRFPKVDFEIPINKNEAFILSSTTLRADFTNRFKSTAALYYQGQPDFEEVLQRIALYIDSL